MSQKITPLQDRFISEYLANGQNGTQAYLAASGGRCNTKTAAREAHKLLFNKRNIAQEITRRMAGIRENSAVDAAWIMTRYIETFDQCAAAGDTSNQLRALDSMARLLGLFDRNATLNVRASGGISHQLTGLSDADLARISGAIGNLPIANAPVIIDAD